MDMQTTSLAATTSMHMHTTSAMSAMPSSSSSADMDMGMGMGMGDGPACKISMLWNWYTVDACFLSSQWRITSEGMMAGSCIGVVVLVVVLEALRRASKEYDRHLGKKLGARAGAVRERGEVEGGLIKGSESESDGNGGVAGTAGKAKRHGRIFSRGVFKSGGLRPSFWEQGVRATLHMCQFAVAYFIMLLAMYFNGYIIISILVGAFIGAFIFSWEEMRVGASQDGQRELTYCCG